MLRRTVIHRAAVLIVVLVAGACTTVATRVDEHRALFESLDSETQQILLGGETRLGYTMGMTYIALGGPDEVRRAETESGETVTWVYQYRYGDHYHSGAFLHQSAFHHGGHYHGYYDPFFYSYAPYHAGVRDYLRVTFTGGRVSAIEHIE